MNKRRVDTDVNEKRMLTRQEAANYLGVGLRAAREFCDSCHATLYLTASRLTELSIWRRPQNKRNGSDV